MTVTEKIRFDYGTVKRFARVEELHYHVVLNTLAGDLRNKGIIERLIELEYIQSAADLVKV